MNLQHIEDKHYDESEQIVNYREGFRGARDQIQAEHNEQREVD